MVLFDINMTIHTSTRVNNIEKQIVCHGVFHRIGWKSPAAMRQRELSCREESAYG
jgi:phage-related protein